VVVTLSQEAYDKYGHSVKPGGLLIVDDEKVHRSIVDSAVKIPISRLAYVTTGKTITANTVALGVLVGLTGVVSRKAIAKAVTARAPRGTEEMNAKALLAGFEAAEKVQKETIRN
jgi:2-oxoglutarate ferredoxin oxidoreductase subunit gamma